MKFFITIILLFSLSVLAADNPFAQYVGCYKTVALNQKMVNSDGKPYLTRVTLGSAFLFSDVTGQEIPAVSMMFYRGQDKSGATEGFDSLDVFSDRGVVNDIAGGHHFSFDGQLTYRFQQSLFWNVSVDATVVKIAASPLTPEQLEVTLKRIVKGQSSGNLDNVFDTYRLEARDCR